MPPNYSYGAKLYDVNKDTLVIQQTVEKTGDKTYRIDRFSDRKLREKFIKKVDDKAIADAIRNALERKL
jgi:hypothetical protein